MEYPSRFQNSHFLCFSLAVWLAACHRGPTEISALSGPLDRKNRRSGSGSVHAAGPIDWQAWQKRRLESVGGTNGWTTLIGLHWLNEGSHSAGSSSTNDVVLRSTRVPASIGVFTRHGSSVSFTAAPDADVRALFEFLAQGMCTKKAIRKMGLHR